MKHLISLKIRMILEKSRIITKEITIMTSKSEYQPDFVLRKENDESVNDNNEEKITPSSVYNTTILENKKSELIKREFTYIQKQRKKIRFFDPKGVYFYRHVTISYFQSTLHLLSLLLSCYLISSMLNFSAKESKEFIAGIGWISNTTAIDTMTTSILLMIISIQLIRLFKKQGIVAIKRYRLAMLSNAVNRVVLNLCKLILLFLSLIMLLFIFNEVNNTPLILESLENGVPADILNVIFCVFTIFIVLFSFRFCGKELAE